MTTRTASFGLLIVAICLAICTAAGQTEKNTVNGTAKQPLSADEQAIRKNAEAFTKAFNRGDAKAVAQLWAKDGQLVIDAETIVEGREAIKAEYFAFLKENPKAKIRVSIKSIRLLGPSVAIEKGTSQIEPPPDDGVSVLDEYTLVHTKQNGQWFVASANVVQTQRGPEWQEQLEFLIGRWKAASQGWRLEMQFEWLADKNFMRRRFSVYNEKQLASSGVQVIGWDPIERQIRSWTFGSEGGFGNGYWTLDGKSWFVEVEGTTRDGEIISATNVFTMLGDDEIRWQSQDRTIEDYQLADTDPIRIVREKAKP